MPVIIDVQILREEYEMNQRTERLRELMADNNLSAADVGELLTRKTITVRIWRCKSDTRTIPATALELLELKLTANKAEA